MNENNFIGIATEELFRVFDILNEYYFQKKLQAPMITIQRALSKNNLGYFTLAQIWRAKENIRPRHEINISAEHLKDKAPEVVETLLHEMVHYSNRSSGVIDCNGNIHNLKFKQLAESVDLKVEKSKKYGYGFTSCSEKLLTFINDTIKPSADAFSYFRQADEEKGGGGTAKPKSTFTFKCPHCNAVAKAKNDVKIVCGACLCDFEIIDDD